MGGKIEGNYPYCHCRNGSEQRNIGLVASSLRGDIVTHQLENEPNDSDTVAQAAALGGTIIGDITVPASGNVNINLDIDDGDADLDVYLFNSSLQRLAASLGDNAGTGDPTELITISLTPGTYFIGIQAFLTPNGRTEYTSRVGELLRG